VALNQTKKNIKKKSTTREYAEAIIIALILALFIRTFIVQAFKIPSGSMEPTLLVGDHLLVNKFIYGIKLPFLRKTIIPISQPQREDIIVFIYPRDRSKDFIKRVIGLPGEKVEVRDRKIFINGKPIKDPHAYYSNNRESEENFGSEGGFQTMVVPKGYYFVMGDNRDHSYDSRFWGPVPSELIIGKAFIIYWSWPHWDRFMHLIK
jgi:signal peptidase I